MTRELLNKKLGENIRKHRLSANISQVTLAQKAGLYPAYLGRLERGEKCPTVDTLYKICSALDVSMSQVLSFEQSEYSVNSDAAAKIERALEKLDFGRQLKLAEIIEKISDI